VYLFGCAHRDPVKNCDRLPGADRVGRAPDASTEAIEPLGPGDYMGFPTDGTVHHLRNVGDTDLVYLMGGERTATEVSRFPSISKVGVFDRGRVSFFDEASVTVLSTEQWRPKK
jgi:uncharacterized cupin superfamily protein